MTRILKFIGILSKKAGDLFLKFIAIIGCVIFLIVLFSPVTVFLEWMFDTSLTSTGGIGAPHSSVSFHVLSDGIIGLMISLMSVSGILMLSTAYRGLMESLEKIKDIWKRTAN